MSMLEKLNDVQEIRQSKYSEALRKSPVELASAAVQEQPALVINPQIQQAIKSQAWMFKSILVLLVLLVAGVGLVIFLLLKGPSSPKTEIKPEIKSNIKPETKPAPAVMSEAAASKTAPKTTKSKRLRKKTAK